MSDTPTTLVSSRVYSGFWESPGDTLQSSESSFCKERPISTLEPAYAVDNDNDKEDSSDSPEPTYVVQKLNNKDDAGYVKNWKLQLHQFLPLTAIVAIGAYWLYVTFRVRYILALQFVSGKVFPVAWVFLAVEIGVALPLLFSQFLQLFSIRTRYRPRLRVIGDYVPRVDVLITCAGEDADVILDTVRAAGDVDWPQDRLRIILLDDKPTEEVRREVQLLGLSNPSIHYTARTKIKGVPHHFKAGNLNHGLRYVDELPGGPAEFIAALDADMIAERCWLRAVVAHLLADPDLALACPPQLFYNVPTNDPLYQNLAFFTHILEGIKDSIETAWCTGSGYVVRRAALDQIGGFPTGSVAEDVYCSSLLLGAGWKTCYVHEALQYGMIPDSFTGHIKQRTRWTIGSLQTSAKLNFFLFGPVVRGMTFYQRFCGLVFILGTLSYIPSSASLLVVPTVLLSGLRLVAYADFTQLRWLLRLALFSLLCNRVNEWIAFLPAGYRFAWRGNLECLWMAPYHAIAIIRSFVLPKWLGGKIATFSSSGSISSVVNERDISARAPLWRRIKVIWWDYYVIIHVTYLCYLIAAVTVSTVRAFTDTQDTYQARLFYILTHVAWPPLVCLVAAVAAMIPIKYTFFPPAMPDREDLLRRELGTRVAHPIQSAREPAWRKSNLWLEGFYGCVTAYVAVLGIGSWFF